MEDSNGQTEDDTPLKKILIIRFSSIGDIVLTTPVVRCLKNKYKDCEIHFLTKQQNISVLENNPYIDKIHIYNKGIGLHALIKDLKKENFDFVVDLHKNLRSKRVLLALRKPYGTFNKLNFKKWNQI